MRLKTIDALTRNRCQAGHFDAIKEGLGILLENGLVTLRLTKEDHRYSQGYLQALEDFSDLLTKP